MRKNLMTNPECGQETGKECDIFGIFSLPNALITNKSVGNKKCGRRLFFFL